MADENKKNQSQSPNGGEKKPDGKNTPAPPKMGRGAGWLVLLALAMMLIVVFQTVGPQIKAVTWNSFVASYEDGSIDKTTVEMTDRAVVAVLQSDIPAAAQEKIQFKIPPQTKEKVYADLMELTGGDFKTNNGPGFLVQLFMSPLFFMLILILLFWFLIFRGIRSASGGGGMLGNFGKSRHRVLSKEQSGVVFNDVAGVNEAKDELVEVVEFHPQVDVVGGEQAGMVDGIVETLGLLEGRQRGRRSIDVGQAFGNLIEERRQLLVGRSECPAAVAQFTRCEFRSGDEGPEEPVVPSVDRRLAVIQERVEPPG